MNIRKVIFLATVLGTIGLCSGYRILGIFPLPKQSHWLVFDELFKGLARKGHQVDLISVHPLETKQPNYTQIFRLQFVGDENLNHHNFIANIRTNLSLLAWTGEVRCEQIRTKKFIELAQNPPSDPPYDLIITQLLTFPCYGILGHLWQIPVVLVSTGSLYPWMYHAIGNPANPAYMPNNIFPLPEGNNFWTRFYNTHRFNLVKLNFLYHSKRQDLILKRYFGPNAPSVREIENIASLVLINTYFPINGVMPTTQGLVEIGGLHIKNEDPQLSGDLKKWADESKKGLIYFSLGSIFSIDSFPEKVIKIILNSLQKMAPLRVVMRIKEPEKFPFKIPKNVLAMSWIPQEKILQHPNTKVFLTHCGLLGTQEAIHYGVPMMCMPLVFDQWNNARNYASKKIAVKVDLTSVTQEEYDSNLHEILNNPIYRDNIKKFSNLFRDRPQKAMDTAIFWIEYIGRNGKDSLKSPLSELSWWQAELLDVYAVTFLILIVIISIVAAFLIGLTKLIFKKEQKPKKPTKKLN